jgi:signal transduction histidine kinase
MLGPYMTQQYREPVLTQNLASFTLGVDPPLQRNSVPNLCSEWLQQTLKLTSMSYASIWLSQHLTFTCLSYISINESVQLPSIKQLHQVIKQKKALHGSNGCFLLPLQTRGQVIGVLQLGQGPHALTDPIIELAANWIASSLDQRLLLNHMDLIAQQNDKFLSIISHDLRNPMSSIKGYADLLLRRSERQADDPNRHGLKIISEQTLQMNKLLDLLLDISQLSNQCFELEQQQLNLQQLIVQVTNDIKTKYSDREFIIKTQNQEMNCVVDARRIAQVVDLIINNAVKYSQDKPITISLEQFENQALIQIHSFGLEILSTDAAHIFEPFYRGSNTGHTSGAGLGLYLAQQIMFRHYGDIWFEQDPNGSTSFFLSLPLSIEDVSLQKPTKTIHHKNNATA